MRIDKEYTDYFLLFESEMVSSCDEALLPNIEESVLEINRLVILVLHNLDACAPGLLVDIVILKFDILGFGPVIF